MADERIAIEETDSGLVLTGNLQIRRIDHGWGAIPILELTDKYSEREFVGLLQYYAHLAPDDTGYDVVSLGRFRITVEPI